MLSFLIMFVIFTTLAMIGGRAVSVFFSLLLSSGIVFIVWIAGPWFGLPSYDWPYEAPKYFWTVFAISAIVTYFGFNSLLRDK